MMAGVLSSWRLGVAGLLWIALTLPCLAEKRVALVIGNSGYRNTIQLANPVKDAEAVAQALRTSGFETVIAHNNLANMEFKRALREFTIAARNADIAVVYFAGHGIEVRGTNFLVPVDAKLASDYDVEDEAVSLNRVIEAVEPAKRLRVIILDACRDNPLGRTMQRAIAMRAAPTVGLAKVEPTSSNFLIAYAAKAGSTAEDGIGDHSPFADALLKHLTTPGLEVGKVFRRVRDEVLKSTDYRQEPYVYSSLGGDDLSLFPVAAVVAPQTTASAANPIADMRHDYELAERIGTKEAWESFLSVYKFGLHADLARAALSKISAQADRARRELKAADPIRENTGTGRVEHERPSDADRPKRVSPDKTASAGLVDSVPNNPNKVLPRTDAAVCGPQVVQQLVRQGSLGGAPGSIKIGVNLSGANEVRTVAISPNGNEIATAGDDGLIRVWNAASFKLMRTLRGHQGPVYSIDYAPDGTLMASASWDGTVRLWSPGSDRPMHTFEAKAQDQAGPVKQFSVSFYPVTPLKYVASGGEDGYVRIWDLQRRELARTKLDHTSPDMTKRPVRSLSFAPDGSGEFVTAGFDGKVRFYFTEGGRVDVKEASARKTMRVAYSPDGARLVSAGSEAGRPEQGLGYLKLWNVKSQAATPLKGHGDYVISASWSPDGTRIASGGGGLDRSVRLWDGHSGRPLAEFTGHTGDIEAVIFDARRGRLISVSEDKTMKVWDIAGRREILTVIGFGDKDYVAYTPDACYSGSDGIESRLSVLDGNTARMLSNDMKAKLFVPPGVSWLQ
jgi:WD40 repeat protein